VQFIRDQTQVGNKDFLFVEPCFLLAARSSRRTTMTILSSVNQRNKITVINSLMFNRIWDALPSFEAVLT